MIDFPLPSQDFGASGLRSEPIEHLCALIERHVGEGRYPGCQVAIARHGRLVLDRSFGHARTGADAMRADERTLWLLYSNTKVITAVALWKLAEEGGFAFTDRVSDHVPEFARHGKRDVTVMQVITHQGGFPNAVMPEVAWEDRDARRRAACDFALEWTPGSKIHYHGLSAHWVLAVMMESITGRDFRDVIRESVTEPLGLARELYVGLPESEHKRAATMYEPLPEGGMRPVDVNNTAQWRLAGAPGGGGYGSARAMAALYQMMLAGGELGGKRILSPRVLAYAIRNWTGDRIDEFMGMPMHRGLGPHLRGTTALIRGLGAFAPPTAFGHGGVGSSYCWADPESGVSFAYVTNNRIPDPWHSQRLDRISNFVHTAIG